MNASVNIPRSEYPRPNLVRKEWICLNGEWDFKIDNSLSGEYLDYKGAYKFDDKIILPFCPESKLSGIGNVDFMNCVWYKRALVLPDSFKGKEVILHIGACDWETKVFVNGKKVAGHKGGYTPISANITSALRDGENVIAVEAIDDIRSGKQIAGKQSVEFASKGCKYTRTTGIWQTVWLEAVDKAHIVNYGVQVDIDSPSVSFDVTVSERAFGKKLSAFVTYEGRAVGEGSCTITEECAHLDIALSERHLWEVGKGRLYDVRFEISDTDSSCDVAEGYFGLRTVALNKNGFFINGEYIFGRFVLDQGFYPDGIYTAPTDEALRKDITDSMSLGFNGARLHQKVFEPRFLYHADKLGYMLWDETGNWGWDHSKSENVFNFIPEWLEEMERDKAHPALIGWCPLNETWDIKSTGGRLSDEMACLIYNVTKAKDPTRPVIINSGFVPSFDLSGHIIGAAYDIHDYQQNPEDFAKIFEDTDKGIIKDQLYRNPHYKARQIYDPSKALFVSEYGGIGWVEEGEGWGYGASVKSKEEFLERLEGLTSVLRENPDVCGFCYTQLYDVEQEKNGILTYERAFKFDPEKIAKIFAAPSVKERELKK